MSDVIGQLLPNVVAYAIIPVPIVVVLVLLTTASGLKSGVAFLVGWLVCAYAIAVTIVAVGVSTDATSGPPSQQSGWVHVAIAALFLALAASQVRALRRSKDHESKPALLARVGTVKPFGALVVGLLLPLATIKNYPILVNARLIVDGSGLNTAEILVTMAIYVIIGSTLVIAPVLVFAVSGDQTRQRLDNARLWLQQNQALVLLVLFVLLGAAALGKAISILSST